MMGSMKQRKPVELRAPYKSPFRLQRDWVTILAGNSGATALATTAAITLLAIVTMHDFDDPDQLPAIAQQIHIIDGDTIDLDGRRFRLYGIDAPELGQPCTRNNQTYNCGQASREHLAYLLTGEKVDCELKSRDKWGRDVAICRAGSKDISSLMVRHGWATAYTQYSTAYVGEEEFAQKNELGLWAKEFALPQDWRNRREKE